MTDSNDRRKDNSKKSDKDRRKDMRRKNNNLSDGTPVRRNDDWNKIDDELDKK